MSISVCLGELACLRLEAIVILGVELSDFCLKGVVNVRALHQGDQALNNKLGVEGGHPSVFNGLCADFAGVLLHVGVENLGLKENLRCFEGVVIAEVNVNNEFAALIRSILGSIDCCVPVGQAVAN